MAAGVPVVAWYSPTLGLYRATFRGSRFEARTVPLLRAALVSAGAAESWVWSATGGLAKELRAEAGPTVTPTRKRRKTNGRARRG